MKIGCPKEIKAQEGRVGLTPAGVDYPAFEKLLNAQVEAGIDALVICGTTGEGSTLSDAEHREVLEFALRVVNGRVPMIAGTLARSATMPSCLSLLIIIRPLREVSSHTSPPLRTLPPSP